MQIVFTEEGVGRRYGTSHNRGRCGEMVCFCSDGVAVRR